MSWGLALYREQRQNVGEPDAAAVVSAAPGVLGGISGAISRAFAKFPHLRPETDSDAIFRAWFTEKHPELDDPDEIAAQISWLRNHATWPKTKTALATISEPETSPETPAPDPQPAIVVVPVEPGSIQFPNRKQLDAVRAAKGFVAWARQHGHSKAYNDAELTGLMHDYFRAENIEPLHAKVIRPELKKLAGVRKEQLAWREPRRSGGSKLVRMYHWTIQPLDDEAGAPDPPWTDLPYAPTRRAA